MVNKKLWLGMLVMVLVFGMTVVGCDDSSAGETDTWADVTSLYQLNGIWKGSYNETITRQGVTMKTLVEVTLTINASDENVDTMSWSQKVIMTFSGNNLNTMWPSIRDSFVDPADGYTADDSKHTITGTWTASRSIRLSTFLINQNGTKIKQLADEEEDTREIIFIKQ
jgi:hypothetical protein